MRRELFSRNATFKCAKVKPRGRTVPPASLRQLQDHRLVIFAGKGGVGKTTCSSASALWLSEQGKHVLVVTVDPAKRLKDSLGVDVGFTATPITGNLHAMMLDPKTVVAEYVKKYAPDKYEEVVKHDLFKYVSEHMPGLNELLAIGKLTDLRDAEHYDIIVVDTAPTGHALNFLSAPRYIKELFEEQSLVVLALKTYKLYAGLRKMGSTVLGMLKLKVDEGTVDIDFEALFKSIAAEAERINKMLTDPSTVLNVVTVPERMPVEESLELLDKVKELGIGVGVIIVNKVQPDELAELRQDFLDLNQDEGTKETLKDVVAKAGYDPRLMKRVVSAVEFSDLRRQMNLHWLRELQERSTVPVVEVPLQKRDVAGLEELHGFGAQLFAEPPAQAHRAKAHHANR
ncbi:MAG: arsenical pump-driving ATPase GET3 [Halobacteriales archaeon]|nr:arsenical pump-driving ATPase GET3 [Halobacteriales archaeon]